MADDDVGFLREYAPDECMRRLVRADRLRCVGRGLYVVVDPVRETPPIAIANGLFADQPHSVTTDAALAFHGLIDQPIPTITVVLAHPRRPIDIGPAVVRPVTLGPVCLEAADALAEPHWMVYCGILAEVIAASTDDALERVAAGALTRSTAAGQRLGYLIEEGGRQPANGWRTSDRCAPSACDPETSVAVRAPPADA